MAMARVPIVERSDLPPSEQDAIPYPLAIFKALANSPRGARAFNVLGGYVLSGSKLDARLRELAILQVGWMAQAPYEWVHHVALAPRFGVSEADIQGLIDNTDGKPTSLDVVTRTVLRAARGMSGDGLVTDADFQFLQAALGNEQLVDLIIAVGFYCGVVRMLAALTIDVEPDYRSYLDRWPMRV
jgi:alkylhydroperoxidase family enzyme